MGNILDAFLQLGLRDNLTKPLRTVEQGLKDADGRFKALAKSMQTSGVPATDKLVASLAKLRLSSKDITAVSEAWQRYAKSAGLAGNSSNWTKAQLAGAEAWGKGMISVTRRVSAEQARFFANQSRMARESRGLLGGPMVGMAVGGGMLTGVKKAITQGATTQEEVARLTTAGAKPEEIDRARAAFRAFSGQYAGVTEADFLGAWRDARVNVNRPEEIGDLANYGARFKLALRNSGASSSDDDVLNVIKSMDELAYKDNAHREMFLDAAVRMQQVFGKQVPTETYLAALRRAHQARFEWSDKFSMQILPTLLASEGVRGGSEIATALSNYVGKHMSHAELVQLAALGFVNNKDLIRTKNGDVKGVKPGKHMFEEDVFESNPFQWSIDFHQQYMKRKGSTERGFNELIARMPQSMGGLIALFVEAQQRFERDQANMKNAVGSDAASNAYLAQNPGAALAALQSSLEQFGSAVTSPLMIKAGEAMTSLAETIQGWAKGWSEWSKSDPGDATAAGVGIAGAGLYGGTKLLYGAFKGFSSGFGLKGSAAALTGSAEALNTAAGRLGVAGGGAAKTAAGGAAAGGLAGGFSLAGLATWLGIGIGTAAADIKGTVDYANLGDDERKAMRDSVKALPSLVPGLTVGQLQKRNQQAFLHFFGLGPGPGDDKHELPYAGQLPADIYDPLSSVRAPPRAAWPMTPDQRAMAAAYGFKIDDVKPKAEEGKAALDQLNAPVKLDIDMSALDAAIARIAQVRDGLASLGRFGGGSVPSLGSTQRGSFTTAWPGD